MRGSSFRRLRRKQTSVNIQTKSVFIYRDTFWIQSPFDSMLLKMVTVVKVSHVKTVQAAVEPQAGLVFITVSTLS